MVKIQRSERLSAMTKILGENPGKIFTLGYFSECFGSARSTISEDIDILQNLFERQDGSRIETIPGASGGVRYYPELGKNETRGILEELCQRLSNPERILTGGFLYLLDIIYSPRDVENIGKILAGSFYGRNVDYVVTVETKGIPIAYATARFLNVPLVIVRHNIEVTDGSSVYMNYVSGSSKTIQTMALPLRAVKRNSKVLFVDDFMKGGGTAKGIIGLMREFDSEVIGIGVLVETSEPSNKLVSNTISLLKLAEVDEVRGLVDIKPCIKCD